MEKIIQKVFQVIRTPWVMVVGAIILFFIIKIPQIDYRYGDENIYFLMGKFLMEGQLPYRDFFFASPPLQLIFTALLFTLLGFRVLMIKFISLLTVAGSALFLYLILRRNKSEIAGVYATVLYLFSFVTLTTSDYVSGIQLVVLFALSAFYLIERERLGWAGVLAAFSLFTRLYAVPLVGALALYVLLKKGNLAGRFLINISLLFVVGNILLYSLFGTSYEQDVILYHFMKFEELDKQRVLEFFLRWDWLLLIMSGLSLVLVRLKKLALPLLGLAAGSMFLYVFKDVYYLYFNLITPFLALLGGLCLTHLFHARPFSFIAKKGAWFIALILGFYVGYGTQFYIRDHAGAARINYLPDLIHYVEEHSNPHDSLYGSFEVAPLVAGFTGRAIAGNFIDTNNKTFSTGIMTLHTREEVLLRERVRFILTKVLVDVQGNLIELGRYISLDYLRRYCAIAKSYPIERDYYSNLLLVWECRYE
ncbi:MAG: glycosyltransferase family 39 protein [Patescibacteria group bacterium]